MSKKALKKKSWKGCTGHVNALNLKELKSKLINCYPVHSKGHEEVVRSFKHFCGARKVGEVYSDNSGELIKATKAMKINHEGSQPGVAVSNCIAERNNQDIMAGTKATLETAGLPACCWPYAAPHYCFTSNTAHLEGVQSAWAQTHMNGEFPGFRVPFGAKVLFKPSNVRTQDLPGKMESDALVGVFAGYQIEPGYKWNGVYLVWPIGEFDTFSLKKDTRAEDFQIRTPHKTSVVKFSNGPWEFPLRAKYVLANYDAQGRSEGKDAAVIETAAPPPANADAPP